MYVAQSRRWHLGFCFLLQRPLIKVAVPPLVWCDQLVFHPEHRITVDEALEHAYLADLHGQVSQQPAGDTLHIDRCSAAQCCLRCRL